MEYHVASVGKSKDNVGDIPLVVRLLFEQFNPHVGDSHREAVVKANTSLGHWATKSWHSRNICKKRD